MTTIDASLVAAGVGLPPVWRGETDYFAEPKLPPRKVFGRLDLTDHQTRAGILRRFAMWAGDDGEARAYWLMVLAVDEAVIMRADQAGSQPAAKERRRAFIGGIDGLHAGRLDESLARIVEHIGRDHRIRRNLGWQVEPGTLATLERADDGSWWFGYGSIGGWWTPTRYPSLAGITDPAEALKAIDEALADESGTDTDTGRAP